MEQEEIKKIEAKKRTLKRYKKNVRKLTRLEEKLYTLEERIESVRSPRLTDMPRGGTPVTLLDLLADKEDLEERIGRQKEINRGLKKDIERELDNLEDVRHVEVLEAFFIDGLTPEDIADRLCYSVRTVYRLYSEGVTELALNCHNNDITKINGKV